MNKKMKLDDKELVTIGINYLGKLEFQKIINQPFVEIDNVSLPNYLQFCIIKLIIDYLLLYSCKKYISGITPKHYLYKKFKFYLIEIKTLSRVSKKWYEIISRLITENIIQSNEIEKWVSKPPLLRPKLSIIKIDKEFVENYHNQLYQYHFRENYQNDPLDEIHLFLIKQQKEFLSKFNKVILNGTVGSNDLIRNIYGIKTNIYGTSDCNNIKSKEEIKLFDHYELNLELFTDKDDNNFKNTDFTCNLKQEEMNYMDNQLKNGNLKQIEMNVLEIHGSKEYKKSEHTFNWLKYVKPNHLNIYPNVIGYKDERDDIHYNHSDFNYLFSSFASQNCRSMKINGSDHIEPYHFKSILNCKSIHTLQVSILFHDIIKYMDNSNSNCNMETTIINNCHNRFGPLKNIDNLNEDWISMNQILSNNCNSLRNLKIRNFCSRGLKCLDGYGKTKDITLRKKDLLSNGLNILFSSKYLNYIKFINFDFIQSPESTFSSLITNNNLSSLKLLFGKSGYPRTDIMINYLFTNVFTSKLSSIKHFTINCCNLNLPLLFNLLSKYHNLINLYSISFYIKDIDQLNYVIDSIKTLSRIESPNPYHSTLKEFTIYSYFKKRNQIEFYKLVNKIKNIKCIVVNIK